MMRGWRQSQPRQDSPDPVCRRPLGRVLLKRGILNSLANFARLYLEGLKLNVPNVRSVPNVPVRRGQPYQSAHDGDSPICPEQMVRPLRLVRAHDAAHALLQVGDAMPLEQSRDREQRPPGLELAANRR